MIYITIESSLIYLDSNITKQRATLLRVRPFIVYYKPVTYSRPGMGNDNLQAAQMSLL